MKRCEHKPRRANRCIDALQQCESKLKSPISAVPRWMVMNGLTDGQTEEVEAEKEEEEDKVEEMEEEAETEEEEKVKEEEE